MSSTKSPQIQGIGFEQLAATESSYLSADTSRRLVYGPETGLQFSKSRRNTTCGKCGEAKGGRGVLCRRCYNAARRAEVTIICVWCGKPAAKKAYELRKALKYGSTDAYCSIECCRAHHAIKNRRRCEICGERCPKKTMRFCSTKCKRANRQVVLKVCPNCTAEFQPRGSRQTYCSRQCANRAHSRRMRGEGNSHFRDGTSYAKWFTEMRPLIFERDERRCWHCLTGGELVTVIRSDWKHPQTRTTLVIHHIDEDPQNNVPENLVTLCQKCHMTLHKSVPRPSWPLSEYALTASRSMTSRWQARAISLRTAYSSTTA